MSFTCHADLKGVELQTRKFTFTQLKDATTNFDQANKIGEGGFGTVYKVIFETNNLFSNLINNCHPNYD